MNLKIAEKKMGFIKFFFKSCREEFKKYYSGKIYKLPLFIVIPLVFIILSGLLIGIFIYAFPENIYLKIFGVTILFFFMLFLTFELTIKFFSYYIYEKIKSNFIVKNKINLIFKNISNILLFFLISLYIWLILEIFYNYFVLDKSLEFLNTIYFYKFYVSLILLLIIKNIKLLFTFKYITFFNFSLALVVLILLGKYNFFPSLMTDFYTIIPFYFIMGGLLKIFFYNYTSDKDKRFLVDGFLKTFKKTLKEKLETDDYQIIYKKYLENLDKLPKPNSIDLLLDKPICSYFDHEEEKDILGHHKITEKLFTIISSINLKNYNNSYTIGLVGEWGIGKSGIINMLNNDWIKGREDMVFYEFSPWNYGKEDLINKFFTDLSNHLDIINFNSNIQKYLKLIGSVEKVNGFGGISEFLGFLLPEKTLDEIKKEINTKLEQYNKKIIVSIDDLDRCEPDEIITMLNLVKNLGNFKNIIYVVSYDKENVLNVIKEKKFGDNYLDKIINTEVFIPTPTSIQVQKYFVNGLEKIITKSLEKKYNYLIGNKLNKKLKKLHENKILDNISKFTKDRVSIFNNNTNYLINNKNGTSTNLISLFEKENLRFIKKLLNQLNIIFNLNFNLNNYLITYSRYRDNNEIYNTSILNIILIINYVKLKDYKYFNFIIGILKDLNSGKSVQYKELPDYFIKGENDFLKDDFLKYISGIYYNYNNNSDNPIYTFLKRPESITLLKIISDIEKYS